jgi:homoserine dehydrogenase
MIRNFTFALLGFGNVGKAFARLLLAKSAELEHRYGIRWSVRGISTRSHGRVIDPDGLNLEAVLGLIESEGDISSLSKTSAPEDGNEFLEECGAQVLFETTPVNYETGQPAVSYLQRGLELGMHAITANKGPVVHAYRELSALAQSKNLHFLFESSVMDGAPIFSLWREALAGAKLLSFRGVLNSTTNKVLSLMEEGHSFEESLKHAQEIGIAETDPSGDIDGWDAAVKVAALVTVLMDTPLTPAHVERVGIGDITASMVQESRAAGKRWKLICEAERVDDGIRTSVYPREIDPSDPLFNVMGTSSSITFNSDVLGALTIIEDDPGVDTTAYGLLADFLNAVRDRS